MEASKKAVFTAKKTEAIFLYDPVIRGYKSTSLYMKTGRIVLFTCWGGKASFVFLNFLKMVNIYSMPYFGDAGLRMSKQSSQFLN